MDEGRSGLLAGSSMVASFLVASIIDQSISRLRPTPNADVLCTKKLLLYLTYVRCVKTARDVVR